MPSRGELLAADDADTDDADTDDADPRATAAGTQDVTAAKALELHYSRS